jgi:hypothetical protein
MQKHEAAALLKEVLAECRLDKDSFILMEPNPQDALSSGYKIKIKAVIENPCRQQLKIITKRHDLAVSEEEDQIVIYKPRQPAGNLNIK